MFGSIQSSLSGAAVTIGFTVPVANAYTQVNIGSIFMQKNIDPIVFPGQYNKSHMHSFFGSDAVTINTNTSASLQEGCTNAENPNDLSIYWVPTLLYTTDDGSTWQPVPLSRFSAYYNLGETPAEVPIPQNLQMLAGSASATTAGDSPADAKVKWLCEGDDGISADANGFPSSTCSTHLQTLLWFPQCVNVDTLETAYKSRSYGTANWCPEGSSSMAQLRFSIRYDLREALSSGWSGTAPLKLACGNAWCSHGDFINGWTEEAAQNMVAATSSKTEYASVNGALGQDGQQPNCQATDADPDNGTSDYAESVAAMGKRSVDAVGWQSRSRLHSAMRP
ncbi:oxidoreductase [Diaporthe helianthi]|uniref:Oxidoreductase n=1 Tax=Diaporthe helianthi TaxID=158607 RepID=A0A2P5IBQ7_DIAHE|nr:oxidoreductase [Diaporthe helianthi]